RGVALPPRKSCSPNIGSSAGDSASAPPRSDAASTLLVAAGDGGGGGVGDVSLSTGSPRDRNGSSSIGRSCANAVDDASTSHAATAATAASGFAAARRDRSARARPHHRLIELLRGLLMVILDCRDDEPGDTVEQAETHQQRDERIGPARILRRLGDDRRLHEHEAL